MSSTAPSSEAIAPKKATDRITNWPEYDRALVARGDITFWFDQAAITQRWRPEPTGKRGAPWRDSDWSIQTLLMLKPVFHLPSRSLEGLGRILDAPDGVGLADPGPFAPVASGADVNGSNPAPGNARGRSLSWWTPLA